MRRSRNGPGHDVIGWSNEWESGSKKKVRGTLIVDYLFDFEIRCDIRGSNRYCSDTQLDVVRCLSYIESINTKFGSQIHKHCAKEGDVQDR